MNNTTYNRNFTTLGIPSKFLASLQTIYISHSIFMVLGTFLNLWLILSILTSRNLREKFRNQLICNMAILHLTESLIKSPAVIAYVVNFLTTKTATKMCNHVATISNLERIQSFIADWLLVILVVVFLAQVLELNPENRLTPLSLNIGKMVLHLLPWVAAVIVTPSLVYFYQGSRGCLSPPYLSHYVFTAINTLTPIVLSLLLTTLAAVLQCLRRRSRATHMGAHLINRTRDIDNSLTYVAAAVTSAACEICNVAFYMNVKINRKFLGIEFEAAGIVLSDSRVIFMIFPWLLLWDIRERIKTWRPWYRPAPGIDLTVAYDKENP